MIRETQEQTRRETGEKGIRNYVELCQEVGVSLLDTVKRLITEYGLGEGESQKEA